MLSGRGPGGVAKRVVHFFQRPIVTGAGPGGIFPYERESTSEFLQFSASSTWLRDTPQRRSIPYSLEAGFVRVWGYTRPGPQPEWGKRPLPDA